MINSLKNNDKKRIAVAMSGGVDSSVAALLLKEKGFDVIGVTMKLWECFKGGGKRTCCSPLDTEDARRVCEQLSIPHHTLDMREQFKKEVIEYFANEYSKGRTPNPCIKCNDILKFNLLIKEVKKLFDADFIATGHYAGVEERTFDGRNYLSLLKGKDQTKDQSYFLFTLRQDQLPHVIFPLHILTKKDVREKASEASLKTAQKGESQDICFIPDGDYAGFIANYFSDFVKQSGNFVDKNGKILGKHEGCFSYTIGQRRGLGFGLGARTYVTRIDVERNEVVLGTDDELHKKEFFADQINWIRPLGDGENIKADVKIRYRHEAAAALIEPVSENRCKVVFEKAQRAITPGQAAVFYDGEEVLGGGWIE